MAEKDNKFKVSGDFRSTTLGDLGGIFPAGVEEGTESEDQFKERLFSFNGRGKTYYDTIKSKLKAHAPEMPLALMYSLFDTESSFKPDAVSGAKNNPTPSLKKLGYTSENMGDHGAKGLGQFMNVASGYQIAEKFGGKAPDELFGNTLHDPFDADQNIEASIKKLKHLIKRFGVSGGLHAYNAGAGRHNIKKDKDISIWANPNYSEKILNNFKKLQGVSEAPKKDSGSEGVIINIGDSNGEIKLRATSAPGLNKAAVGASMKNWLDALELYFEGKSGSVDTGNVKIEIPFKDKSGKPIPLKDSNGKFPTINVSVVGGNDVSKIGESALKDSYIKDVAIELMKYIKKTGGSFGGPAPVSNRIKLPPEMGGRPQIEVRKELNEKLKKAANEMSIPYIDNIGEILSTYGEDNPDSIYGKDGKHLKTSSFKGAQKDDSEDPELDQPEDRKRKRVLRRISSLVPGNPTSKIKYKDDGVGIGKNNIKFFADAIDKDIDFRKYLNGIAFKPTEDWAPRIMVPEKHRMDMEKARVEKGISKIPKIPPYYEIDKEDRIEIFQRLRNYAISPSIENLLLLTVGNSANKEDNHLAVKAYTFISSIARVWANGDMKEQFEKWKKRPFLTGRRFEENKRDNMMKITKERLSQIIKEEVEAYKASQLNEGMDVDEIDRVEGYLKEIADLLRGTYDDLYKAHAPAVFTPQTKAGTGEKVTEKTAHRDAKDFILSTLAEHIDGFEKKDPQEEPQLNEDGHTDVPSAIRAMKTIIEDAGQMLDTLEQMGDGSLPTWWTNKMAVSAEMLNKMRDFLVYPAEEQ